MVMPYYNITDKLQAVTRYSYMKSDGTNGIRLAGYEARVVPGRGDEYIGTLINGYLARLLAEINDRDTALHTQHLDQALEAIQELGILVLRPHVLPTGSSVRVIVLFLLSPLM